MAARTRLGGPGRSPHRRGPRRVTQPSYLGRRTGEAPPTRRRGDGRRGPGPLAAGRAPPARSPRRDRKSTRLNSSHQLISYPVFCLKKKENKLRHSIHIMQSFPGTFRGIVVVSPLRILEPLALCRSADPSLEDSPHTLPTHFTSFHS